MAAYPGSPWASIVPRYRAPAEVRVWIWMRKNPVRRVFSPGPWPGAGSSGLSSARDGPNASPVSVAFIAALAAAASRGAAGPAPNPVTSR